MESRVKTGKTVIFSGDIMENCSNFCPGRIQAPFLHVHDLNCPSFHENVQENAKRPIILTFFKHFFQIYTSPPPKFWDES